jgi:hypothetical protein
MATGDCAIARARRLYWRRLRRYRFEICGRCGRPVGLSCPSYWLAHDELWRAVIGGEGGIRCVPCFDRDAAASGRPVSWRAVERDGGPIGELLDAVRPVLAAYRSTEAGHITKEQITRAWAAFDAVRGATPKEQTHG